MQEYEILKLLVLIFGVSAFIVFLLHRVNIPPLVGFIISGVLIGPSGFGLAGKAADIELLAEIGVVLLLFVIGIEVSLENLRKLRKAMLRGGCIQLLLTGGLTALLLFPLLHDVKQAVFFGFLVALSSTAIVFKMLSERGELDSPHGRVMVGILVFQDLAVVPLMLITPLLGGQGFDLWQLSMKMIKALILVAVVLLAARWFVPRVLHQVVHVKSRELFITAVILLCLGTALLTSQFGLSLALGAFLAGLVVSESEYAHQAISDILPFKDSFIGLFFVSVGMLMDTAFITDYWLKISAAVVLIIVIKFLVSTVAAVGAGASLRPALVTGFGLAQIGEFSFVLAGAGRGAGLITGDYYQLFLSASLVTMLLTPFLIRVAPGMSVWATARLLPKRLSHFAGSTESRGFPKGRSGHVVIVGFGLNGRNLAHVLGQAEIPYVALEINSDTVREMKKKKEPIYYGDGTSAEILTKMGIREARALVVAISDAASSRRIVQTARRANPALHIIVRTRYVSEVEDLKNLGANEVIPEEFETSIEIFSKVLDYYLLPRNLINDYINSVRCDNYKALRKIDLPRQCLMERQDILRGIDTESYLVKEDSRLAESTIAATRLRTETGGTILAVERSGELYQNPSPEFLLKRGDVLVLVGKQSDMQKALAYLDTLALPGAVSRASMEQAESNL